MNWKEYEKEAMRTVNNELTQDEKLYNAVMGLYGELGEVTDILKKHFFQNHDLDLEHIKEELGDVLWYLALLTNVLDLDLDEIKQENINKLRQRYSRGFSSEESINRKE